MLFILNATSLRSNHEVAADIEVAIIACTLVLALDCFRLLMSSNTFIYYYSL